MTEKCQRFVKLKELQADTQANAFAAHLILPNRTQSPPTTLTKISSKTLASETK
jgi:Zn-dependent peptidase ImmA (M78 family)